MDNLKKRLANLLCIKSIVTMTVIAVWAVLALKGIVNAESVMYIVTAVVSFYFGTQIEKNVEK